MIVSAGDPLLRLVVHLPGSGLGTMSGGSVTRSSAGSKKETTSCLSASVSHCRDPD